MIYTYVYEGMVVLSSCMYVSVGKKIVLQSIGDDINTRLGNKDI